MEISLEKVGGRIVGLIAGKKEYKDYLRGTVCTINSPNCLKSLVKIQELALFL
jgi:hypothetical protein